MCRLFVSVAVVCMTACVTPAQAPITVLDLQPEKSVLQDASWCDPHVISSREAAAGYFGADAANVLRAQVDFERQFLLVFAWQGSGGDRLSYRVAESFPEQVFFSMQRGLTRDLRSHTQVYALRSDVRWSIEDTGNSLREEAAGDRANLPVPGSRAWLEEVDRLAGVRDAHGCGPEISSPAWFYAVSLRLGVYDEQGHGPDPDSDEWRQAVHRKAFGAEP